MFEIKKADAVIQNKIEKYSFFDFYRIVNADTYMVYELLNDNLISQNECCYSIWERGAACQNCVSRIAVSEERQIIKLETVGEKVFLIASLPLSEYGDSMALELIKDVTQVMFLGDASKDRNVGFSDIVKQMNDMAIKDSYTGMFNNRYCELELHRSVYEWRPSSPFSIAVFNIDSMDAVNSAFGHREGDNVILAVSDIIKQCAEENGGWAARLEGDKFLLAFKGVALEEAHRKARAICAKTAEKKFGDCGKQYNVTVSVGACEYNENMGGWKEMLNEADSKMKADKLQKA